MTPALNQAGISTSDLIRFIPDGQNGALPQKLGGWTTYYNQPMTAIVRALWAWEDTNANKYLAIGTENVGTTGSAQLDVVPLGKAIYPLTPQSTTASNVIFTGSISGVTLTVGSSVSGIIDIGQTITGNGIAPGTSITAGSGTSWTVSSSQTVGNTLITAGVPIAVVPAGVASYFTITDTATTGITKYDSVYITTPISVGGTVLFGMYAANQDNGGSNTTYDVQATDILGTPIAASYAEFTGSITGTALTVSTVTTGAIRVGQTLTGTGITAGTKVVSGSGASWTVSVSSPSTGTIPIKSNAAVTAQFIVTPNQTSVTVRLPNHGYSAGSTFPALIPTTVGGVTFSGQYVVQSVSSSDPDTFTINASQTPPSNAYYTASRSGTNLTVTTVTSGNVQIGQTIAGTGITAGTITSQTSGIPGGAGVYVVSSSQTIGSTDITATYPSPSSGYMNSGNAYYIYNFGVASVPQSTGYGAGPYNDGAYGGSSIAPATGTNIAATDWTLDNWGDVLLACPINSAASPAYQPIYQWNPLSGSPTATVIPAAPVINDGMFVAMPERQIIAWGSSFNGAQDPLLIRWCDVNNYNTWIATVTNQAGSYRIPKGSAIIGCIQGPQQGLIWTDIGLWSMQYIGQPYVYSFNEIGVGCGLIARKAAGSLNGVVYWMAPSNFYRLSGQGVEPMPCPLWDVIFQDLDTTNLQKIRVAVNSRFSEIAWYYPAKGNGGEINAYVKYNVVLNTWDYGSLSRTAWIDQSVLGPPIGADPSTLFLYQHETSTDAAGTAMTPSLQTGYFAISEGEQKSFVDQVWPDMRWGYFTGTDTAFYGANPSATVNLTFYVTDYPGQQPRAYGPYPVTQDTDYISPRFRGRLVSIKVSSDDLGTFWRLGNIRYRITQDGKY